MCRSARGARRSSCGCGGWSVRPTDAARPSASRFPGCCTGISGGPSVCRLRSVRWRGNWPSVARPGCCRRWQCRCRGIPQSGRCCGYRMPHLRFRGCWAWMISPAAAGPRPVVHRSRRRRTAAVRHHLDPGRPPRPPRAARAAHLVGAAARLRPAPAPHPHRDRRSRTRPALHRPAVGGSSARWGLCDGPLDEARSTRST